MIITYFKLEQKVKNNCTNFLPASIKSRLNMVNEANIESVLELIKNKTKDYISKISSKEICFNVYGNNTKIINLVRVLGFKTDMEGFHLQYIGKELPKLKEDPSPLRTGEGSSFRKKVLFRVSFFAYPYTYFYLQYL